MTISPAVLGITAVIELIRFVQTSRELRDKSAEEVLDLWAESREDVRQTLAVWRAGGLTPSGEE